MIGGATVLALIPARGGSKGVPGKNIRPVGGRPLIAWSIAAAKASRYVDRTVLSSDDQGIIDAARSFGCDAPFTRPAELATDEADSMSVVRHAMTVLPERYDYLVLLQPTSPMRLAQDIDRAIERCVNSGAPACVSVCEPDKSPYWMFRAGKGDVLEPLLAAEIPDRRQQAPAVLALNGAVYVARTDHLAGGGAFLAPGTIGYVMPTERSFDIDTELDLRIVDFLLHQGQH
jgi:CMP-N,N'-diacetyllegionaminic acid synthase